MVRKSYGKMRGTRKKLRNKKKPSINAYLKVFKKGEHVHIDLVTSSPLQHPRYQGKTGEIIEKRGRAYAVSVRDGKARKTVFMRPEHLKVQKSG